MECLQCREPMKKSGRRDRKFCSDECRNEYHNTEKFLENAETNKIMIALKQNRRILKILLGGRDELYVGKELLRKRGFLFDYHTHEVMSRQGNRFTLCFNYGYRVLEEDQVKLVHWRN